ncbi:chemotaxis protein CheW [Clostridium sp. ATCC 25772]|uniref:chemotaxis protein CheW n=1 Tax=Clostridium sp. ATCC 25772 TaxID=1676991 RepID=UPI000785C4C4|nr:chemotaxis protein CheW [Clostridium sp. ATCC 25772]
MDTSQYLSMFLEESMDNLQTLNESLLILEQEPNDKERLNEIFRVAHTIKGMAATMGYNTIAELTHKMEDVLSKFREGELNVTPKVVTVLFRCLDNLENMINTIADGEELDYDISDIVHQLEDIGNKKQSDEAKETAENTEGKSMEAVCDVANQLQFNEYDLNVIKQAKDSGFNAYSIYVKLDDGTILKSARAFVIMQALEEHGEIIKTQPILEDLEIEDFDLDINFAYITKENKEIIKGLIEDISEVRIVEVSDVKTDKNKEEVKNGVNSDCLNYSLSEYDMDVIKQAKQVGFNALNISIELDEGTLLKSARVFIIMQELEVHGEVIKSIPASEDLEAENFDYNIELTYITKKTEKETKDILFKISEVKSVEIVSISETNNEKNIKNLKPKEITNKVEKIKEINKEIEKGKDVKSKKTNNDKHNSDKHPKGRTVGQSVRVDLERLDKFMNMVSELVIHRTRLEQISLNHKIPELNETLEQVARSTSDLQDLVMKIRMLPLDAVFNRFPRMIRDLSIELGKEIDLEILGQDTELDRTVIEEIGEPLIHLLRNAADHGIESPEERIKAGKNPNGKIKLIAYPEGTKAVIKVEDDGKGLNVEKIRAKAESVGITTEGMSENDIKNLIFSQGFSTNEVVTDISGRGVGMDVVKTKIAALGGTVDAISELGKGTSFIIRLPLTLQIIQALLVKVGSETMAISLGYIDRVVEYKKELTKKTNNKEVIIYNDNIVNLIRVNEKLNIPEDDHGKKYVVMTKVGEREVGLLVDSLLGQQEIVIKPFGKTLKNLNEYIGATILGDGLVTLILDVASLI